jgi:hypothetical protein
MSDRQTNYTIAENFELPSKGEIYSEKINPQIELRSMTGRDEMKRLNPTNTPLKTLADIIEDCCIEKPKIHVYDMIFGDYEFLLHKLRIVTYGPDYKLSVICPHCDEEVNTTVRLDDIKLRDFDIDNFNEIKTFKLPVSGNEISLNFSTPRMLETIESKSKELKRKMKEVTINCDILARLLCIINTIDGKKFGSAELEYFINNLPARDLNKILNQADKLMGLVGLDTSINITCPHCGEEVNTFFQFGPEFFKPTND